MVEAQEFKIVIDSREKNELLFPGINTVVEKLDTGDYSVSGYTNIITVERKSLGDLFQSVTWGRARFTKELLRMCSFTHKYIIVEASLATIRQGYAYSKVNPEAVIGSLVSFSLDQGIHIIFADNQKQAALYTHKILYKFWQRQQK